MRALVTTGARLMELRDVAEPEPGRREVLLDIAATGICGSDYHLYLGDHPLTRHPMVQGHELCGVVRALGPDCAGDHEVGAQVCVEPLLACGDCYPCRLGRYNCCTRLEIVGVHRPGGFQESIVVPERLLWAADGLDPAVAAFAEPISIALQGVTRASVSEGDSVLILGAGPIGLATVLCAHARGARVAIADLVDERLERASVLGVERAVKADDGLAAAVAEWTGGEGPMVVIEAAGSPAALRSAFEIAPHAGRVVVVGISSSEVTLPMSAFTRKEITVFGARNSARIFPDAVALARKQREPIAEIVTQRVALDDVPETIELALAHPELVEKAVACL